MVLVSGDGVEGGNGKGGGRRGGMVAPVMPLAEFKVGRWDWDVRGSVEVFDTHRINI